MSNKKRMFPSCKNDFILSFHKRSAPKGVLFHFFVGEIDIVFYRKNDKIMKQQST
jgi:hypothetical protein